MEKKLYTMPQTEVMNLGSDVIMNALGPISENNPADPVVQAPTKKVF